MVVTGWSVCNSNSVILTLMHAKLYVYLHRNVQLQHFVIFVHCNLSDVLFSWQLWIWGKLIFQNIICYVTKYKSAFTHGSLSLSAWRYSEHTLFFFISNTFVSTESSCPKTNLSHYIFFPIFCLVQRGGDIFYLHVFETSYLTFFD